MRHRCLRLEDLPHGGGCDRDCEGDEFAVDPPVSPGRVFAGQAQGQGADGAHGGRSSAPFRYRDGRVPLFHQVAVPAPYGLRPDDQAQPAQDRPGQGLQQCGKERPVCRCEGHRARAELALQYGKLVAQGEDLGVLVTVAHRQQAQHGEGVGDGQTAQAKQHFHIVPASYAPPGWRAEPHAPAPAPNHCTLSVTSSTDEIFGRHRADQRV